MRKLFVALGLVSALVLAACGETRGERVVTGAAGGAVAGEVIADEPLAGAAIGGAAGALRPDCTARAAVGRAVISRTSDYDASRLRHPAGALGRVIDEGELR